MSDVEDTANPTGKILVEVGPDSFDFSSDFSTGDTVFWLNQVIHSIHERLIHGSGE